MAFIEVLDLKTLLVDYFLGGMELFIFAFIIIFSFACAKFGMSNRLYMVLLAVSLILISLVTSINGIYVLVVVIIGFISFKAISKVVT
jgi:hypothetical protein